MGKSPKQLSLFPALKQESETDYVLNSGHDSVWITVGKISVNIRRNDSGVLVDLYPLGGESESDSLGSTWAEFGEAD